MCAWDANGWETEGWIFRSCDLTAEDGSYAISISQAGEYEVEFAPPRTSPGLALQFFDQQARWEGAEVLSVGLSETITGIDASLHPGGTISGHVTRAINGQPLGSVQVCSIDASDDELWTCTWTEEDGGYELFSLSRPLQGGLFAGIRRMGRTRNLGRRFPNTVLGRPGNAR